MNVDLQLPPEWATVVADDGSVRATSASYPGVEIVTTPFTIREDNLIAWSRRILCAQLATADAGLVLSLDERSTTVGGWPTYFVIAHSSTTTAASGAFAFYHFLDYAAVASVRGPDAANHLELLRHARPDYSTDAIVALEQLWQ